MTCTKKNGILILVLLSFLPGKILTGQTDEFAKKPVKAFSLSALSYYKTNDKNETFKNILNNYQLGKFQPLQTEVLNGGIPKQFYWIHFTVFNKGDTTGSFIIDLANSRLNETELFKLSDNSLISLGKLGDFYPFSHRLVLHKNFIYFDYLLPEKENDYFLFVNQVGHTFNLPVKIFNAEAFRSTTFIDYLFAGSTYGILAFVAVLSLFFFLNSKHYLYLYYSLYLFTAIVWFLSYFGLGYEYIWGNYPWLNTAMAPSMAALNIALNLKICQVLLRLSRLNKRLNKFANAIKYVLLFLAVFPFCINLNAYGYGLNHTYLVCFLAAILIAMIIVSCAVIAYAFKGVLAAKFYFVASLLKAGSIINLALLELGMTPAFTNMEDLLQIGIFIEIILLTYALAIRYSRYKSRTFVKVIEAHENERAIISQEIHDGISSSLTGLNYDIKNFTRNLAPFENEKAEQLEKIFDELNKMQMEARHISHNTMPDYIKTSSVSDIVKNYIEEIQDRIKKSAAGDNFIRINFSYNRQLNAFPETVKLNIFRIIQEILANILKHSKATNADILFSFSKKEILIVAEDNGTGFNYDNNVNGGGKGLKNIKTRVELLDGDFEVKSPAYKRNSEQSKPTDNTPDEAEYGTIIKIKISYRNNTLSKKPDYEY